MLSLMNLTGFKLGRKQFQEREVVLIIADISGYTEFMLSTQTSLLHGQMFINELIEAIINQIRIPLKVAKLEGDAIFLYAIKGNSEVKWQKTRQQIGEKLLVFFQAFSAKLHHLGEATHCSCDACVNVESLRLKIIVHSGKAGFYRIGRFLELSGVDVIILHRLLKNSVKEPEYLLMTAAAFHDIPIPSHDTPQLHEESYPAIGTLMTYLHPIEHPDHHV